MIYVLLADGFEEIEALTPVDMLRRAGYRVKTVGIGSDVVTGAHGIPVKADLTEEDATPDGVRMVILPGGMPGTKNLAASDFVETMLEEVSAHGGDLAAICAAPTVLAKYGYLKGKRATCFPGFENELSGAVYTELPVVTDGKIITAKDMTEALAFSLSLLATLNAEDNEEKASAASGHRKAIDFEPTGNSWDDNALARLSDALTKRRLEAKLVGIDHGRRYTRIFIAPIKKEDIRVLIAKAQGVAEELGECARVIPPSLTQLTVGFELPRDGVATILLAPFLPALEEMSKTSFVFGEDMRGDPVYSDLAVLPHLLVKGAACSGKSTFVYDILTSILYNSSPKDVKFLLFTPQKSTYAAFAEAPHMLFPELHDTKEFLGVLGYLWEEIDRRRNAFSAIGLKNLQSYNNKVDDIPIPEYHLPRILFVADELPAMTATEAKAARELLHSILLLGRPVGVHMVLASRASLDEPLLDGIEGDFPSNLVFQSHVSAGSFLPSIFESSPAIDDSDMPGDAFFSPSALSSATRVQIALPTAETIDNIVARARERYGAPVYDTSSEALLALAEKYLKTYGGESEHRIAEGQSLSPTLSACLSDPRFQPMLTLAVREGKISTSFLQRKFAIGYSKAVQYLELFDRLGLLETVTEPGRSPYRKVCITEKDLVGLLDNLD